ncbi:MAG TPA: YggT family protein [Candidatus Limnocylindria bacterium]|nr:YggT family protein [Candidatus Limnocylindria bacterium]
MTTTHHDDHPTERVERVERYEQVRDRPVTTPSASNVNVGATRPAPTSVWTVTNVVTLVFTVLEVLLLLRFVFKLTGANANQPLISALYGATEPLVRPFQGIFPEPQGPPVLDIAALLAIAFLFLIALLIVALVRAITNPKHV